MLRSKVKFARLLAVFLLVGLAAGVALAQGGPGQGKGTREGRRGGGMRAPAAREPGERGGPGRGEPRDLRGLLGLPPRWMERLQEMSPDDQERFLNNNERFRSLPPERQAQIRRRLGKWNRLTPDQQREVRERERIWEQMSPEQRRRVRETILPKWQRLEPQRRQALLWRLRVLRHLSEAERVIRLTDEGFLNGLGPEERELLRELTSLRVGQAPGLPELPLENPGATESSRLPC